jgi:CBS domain containing-hemolysin-like protein
MEWIADPSIWAGLVTLVVLELVLGIDNLVFIAILAEKLPPSQRDRARVTGLLLAMVMRLLLLASISWLVTLTKPLVTFHGLSFSARDLIMLFGGLFLLFKATVELNERLEGKDSENPTQRRGARFWPVVAQIVVLDAVFSLDSVITAVGMVDHLAVMMAAVIIAIALMVMASKSLTRFVNSHPTIVILCLSFLLMIGFSLVADGFGFHIPKGYLYAAIGFSVIIESLNQLAIFNRRRFLSANQSLRQRTADTVMRLLSGQKEDAELDAESASLLDHNDNPIFNPQERLMIERVLNLNQRSVSSIMTSRHDIEHIDLTAPEAQVRALLDKNQHTRVVVTGGEDEEDLLGVVHVIDLLQQQLRGDALDLRALVRQPLVFPETLQLLSALEQFRNARTHFAFVVDEFGSVEGLVTLSDVMETIAGNLPNEVDEIDARHDIQKNPDGSWTANGHMPLEDLVQYVPLPLDESANTTLSRAC